MARGIGFCHVIASIVVSVAACAPPRGTPPPTVVAANAPLVTWPTPSCQERAANLVAEMTLAEKVAAMTLPDTAQISRADITALAIGAVLTGAESLPADPTPARWLDTSNRVHDAAMRSGLRVPLVFGTDAIHGHNNVRDAVIFPHAVGLGCTGDPNLVEQVAGATAEAMFATGVDWTFAPMVAVARDERWGRTYEAFGEDPRLVGELTAASIRGLQGSPPGTGAHPVLACAKHFLADGGTVNGEDRGNAEPSERELRAVHLAPYAAAVEAQVGSVMVAVHRVNGRLMHQNKALLTDVLKGELRFGGFVVSNWAAIDELPGDDADRIASAIDAGIDMVMAPSSYQDFIATLRGLVPERIPEARIDDAVSRILAVKCELGMFTASARSRPPPSVVSSLRHRALAREAVARSAVLLKNDGVLPLPKTGHVLVAGRNADDLGHQCGGWTLGLVGGNGPLTAGTTIRQAIEQMVGRRRARFSLDGRGAGPGVTSVVVIGETPYAEAGGYIKQLELDADDVTAVRNAKKGGGKVVVVLVTGRPLPLDLVIDLADAILVVWLPGTEGGGVADVLFGDVPPTGRLSHTWPRTSGQIPINVGDTPYDPLFPFGFGLTYEVSAAKYEETDASGAGRLAVPARKMEDGSRGQTRPFGG